MAVNTLFQNILDAHFGGSMQKQLDNLWPARERPLDPPEDKNAERLAAIQYRIDDLRNEIEELEREYDYIASGDEEEDLRAEAMKLLNDNELAVTAL